MFGREKPASPPPNPSAGPTNPYQPPIQQANTPSGAPAPKIETVLGPNCRMNGMLQSDGGIRIEGVFEGQIQTTGNLVVADTAKVVAEVQAYNVVVAGSLKGNVTANRVEITGSGKLWGDLNVNSLLLNEGAFLKGQTNMGGDIEPPMIEAPKITAPRPVSTAELESANP
ncbi:MAG TPA: polymer-forming cytoskeletal protein [Anaerolineae bacterium]